MKTAAYFYCFLIGNLLRASSAATVATETINDRITNLAIGKDRQRLDGFVIVVPFYIAYSIHADTLPVTFENRKNCILGCAYLCIYLLYTIIKSK